MQPSSSSTGLRGGGKLSAICANFAPLAFGIVPYVTQRQRESVPCSFNRPGWLNLAASECPSIFATDASAGPAECSPRAISDRYCKRRRSGEAGAGRADNAVIAS